MTVHVVKPVDEAPEASAYWPCWSGLTIRFARNDAFRLRAHWPLFVTRSSSVSGASRAASNPIYALLNCAYAILETEVRLAVLGWASIRGWGSCTPI